MYIRSLIIKDLQTMFFIVSKCKLKHLLEIKNDIVLIDVHLKCKY